MGWRDYQTKPVALDGPESVEVLRKSERLVTQGRKSAATKAYQETMRTVFERVVSAEVWLDIVEKAVEDAVNGELRAQDRDKVRRWLGSYAMGRVPEEKEVHGEVHIYLPERKPLIEALPAPRVVNGAARMVEVVEGSG